MSKTINFEAAQVWEINFKDEEIVVNQIDGVSVFVGGVKVGNFRAIDFVAGTNITIQGVANGRRTQITINSTAGGGAGTVTSFSSGNLTPLFTTSVATANSTPAQSFTQITKNANTVFAGPTSGGAANPDFRALVSADIPDLSSVYDTAGSAAAAQAAAVQRANHTGTQLASTISDFNSAALAAAPAETTTTIGALINGATDKATPVDADYVGLMDSAASNILKKLSWANLKSFFTLKVMTTLGDIIYGGASGAATRLAGNTGTWRKKLVQTGDGANSSAPTWVNDSILIYMTSNQSTTSATATGITELITPTLEVNCRYRLKGILSVTSGTANGIKFAVDVPASSSLTVIFVGITNSATTILHASVIADATLTTVAHVQAAATRTVIFEGEVELAGTAGTIQMMFASSTGGDTSTINKLGTILEVTKITP